MDKLRNEEETGRFLRSIGLLLKPSALQVVVNTLSGEKKSSVYDLWKQGYYRDGRKRKPICGKGSAYKIRRLLTEGKLKPFLDYLNFIQTESPVTETDPMDEQSPDISLRSANDEIIDNGNLKYQRQFLRKDHISKLVRLAEDLRGQLTVPLPTARIVEPRQTRAEYFAGHLAEPGDFWYWGWEVDNPVLQAEASPDLGLLQEHTCAWDAWNELENLRNGVKSYMGKRVEVLRLIENSSIESSGLPVSASASRRGGSLTSNFAHLVGRRAMGYKASAAPGYKIDLDRSVSVKGNRFTLETNYPLFYDGIIIAWAPSSARRSDFGYPFLEKLSHKHQELSELYRGHRGTVEVLNQYRELTLRADRLRAMLASSLVRKALWETNCMACL